MKEKQKCQGRTPGNVLTSYACTRNARPGSKYCYSHDPATEAERLERARLWRKKNSKATSS